MKQRLTSPALLTLIFAVLIAVSGFTSPKQDQAHFQRGDELNRSGKYEEAIVEFRKAIRLDLNHFESHYNLGFRVFQIGALLGSH